jgi:hypothetical protein
MKTIAIATAIAAATLVSAYASATPDTMASNDDAAASHMNDQRPAPPRSERVFIPFADMRGTIRNWAESDGDLYIQTAGDHWYQAQMLAPCTTLPYAVSVGFVSDSLGQIDKMSSIVTDSGERCWFKTFDELPGKPDLQGTMHPAD